MHGADPGRTLLIVGQGLAGTLLGYACERAGVAFVIADAGHGYAASRVGAGIINPITGQRLVRGRGFDESRATALMMYRELEALLGLPLVREMRVRRWFRDETERRVFADKKARGELAPYAGEGDAEGFWIEGALRVDTAALIAAARRRWLAAGRLSEERVEPGAALAHYGRVIACTGAEDLGGLGWGGVACVRATGDILRLAVAPPGLDETVILNRGHWVLPTGPGEARIGATYVRGGVGDAEAARRELMCSAAELLEGRAWTVVGQERGVRVTTPDRMPLAGWSPCEPRLGLFNGLGSKGALLAPGLARQWAAALCLGTGFPAEVAAGRFVR